MSRSLYASPAGFSTLGFGLQARLSLFTTSPRLQNSPSRSRLLPEMGVDDEDSRFGSGFTEG